MRRINDRVKDIARNGNEGIGKLKSPLKHGFQGLLVAASTTSIVSFTRSSMTRSQSSSVVITTVDR